MTTTITAHELTGAMMTMESDVELPSRVRVHSAVGNLIALEDGGIYTLSMELPGTKTLAELQEEANGLKSKIRNSMNASIRNAKTHTGHNYSMESALVTYPSGRAFIQVIVTCNASEAYDDANEPEDDEV